MRRVLAVVLIATLTTMMIGIDRTSWASQDRDQEKREKQRAAVTKALGEMTRGSTATIERQDGQKIDVVIEEITPDAVIVMRQQQDHVVTETIPIADIAKIKKTSAEEDEHDVEGVDWLPRWPSACSFVAALASCASASYAEHPGTPESTH